jgi:NAD(P)-dependent dehydrogenase (short-subunit alcohol dehydrogenase family)
MNIRVNAVAPGIVKTPLWTQERLGWVDDSKDAWVTTEQVADAMLEMMTKPEYVGGTVLEIGAEKNRCEYSQWRKLYSQHASANQCTSLSG